MPVLPPETRSNLLIAIGVCLEGGMARLEVAWDPQNLQYLDYGEAIGGNDLGAREGTYSSNRLPGTHQ